MADHQKHVPQLSIKIVGVPLDPSELLLNTLGNTPSKEQCKKHPKSTVLTQVLHSIYNMHTVNCRLHGSGERNGEQKNEGEQR